MDGLQRRNLVRRDRIEVAAVWVPLSITMLPWLLYFAFSRLIGFLCELKVMSNWLRYWMLFILLTGIVVIGAALWLAVLAPVRLVAPANPLLAILIFVVSSVVVLAFRRSRTRLLAIWVMLPGPILCLCWFSMHSWFFWLLLLPVVLSPIASLYSARRVYCFLRPAAGPAAAIQGTR